jgi:hypothetical protein
MQADSKLVQEETKRRESTPLKDVFDHNFMHMHAKIGVRLNFDFQAN